MTDAVAREREAQVKHQYSNTTLYPTIVEVCSVSCVKKGYFKKVIRSSVDQLRAMIYQVATHLRVATDGLKCKFIYICNVIIETLYNVIKKHVESGPTPKFCFCL